MNVLKPGILVSMRTTLRGGVHYERVDLATDAPTDEERDVSRWETERVIENKAEFKLAQQVRGSASSLIRKVCIHTPFGMLCPESAESDLDEAVAGARTLIRTFNEDANHTTIDLYILKGRIAATDDEAARAVGREVEDLLEAMRSGITGLDVKAVREAASKAKALGGMLAEKQQKAIDSAVESARSAAREIVKRVEKAGEDAETVLKQINTTPVELARFAFVGDDTEFAQAAGTTLPAVDLQRTAGLDL